LPDTVLGLTPDKLALGRSMVLGARTDGGARRLLAVLHSFSTPVNRRFTPISGVCSVCSLQA
jgi:hypothetical protein